MAVPNKKADHEERAKDLKLVKTNYGPVSAGIPSSHYTTHFPIPLIQEGRGRLGDIY